MTRIIASFALAASIVAGIGAAQAGPFDTHYAAPGGLYSPYDSGR